MRLLRLSAWVGLCLFVTSSANGAEAGTAPSVVQKLVFPSAGEPETRDLTAELLSDGSFSVAWRLSEPQPSRLTYYRKGDVFSYETPDGSRAVRLSGEREPAGSLAGIPSGLSVPVTIQAEGSEVRSVQKDRTWSYRLPDGRQVTAGSLHTDDKGDLFFQDDAQSFYSLDGKGQLRFVLSAAEASSPVECRAAPNGDAVCLSPEMGVIGIRAESDAPRLFIDGKEQFFPQPPVLKGGAAFVPFRGLFEALSASVSWDAKSRTVKAVKGKQTVRLTLGSKTAEVNGKRVSLDAAPYSLDGSTMVPLRFAGEALGSYVVWEAATRTIQIASK
ncbi:copper amine oxidase N-terminal domain-containing protein [Cohnella caldifontis]|uniref:copper amine oxidase N-terminal domain-containing protein n=1 Tax=Cohnella caldifontis TaxID=3027471 RepID=UPI0023EDEA16|nr:copper amine oxidase N-terminal domain-containing protein [Cohnella sp. YIM B05605]